jgi:hypothetical protein
MNTSEIETVLRAAPGPKPPAGLKARLIEQAPRYETRRESKLSRPPPSGSWLRRWWPALAPAGVSLACAAVLTVQQMEIGDLEQTLQALAPSRASREGAPDKLQLEPPAAARTAPAAAGPQEIKRLEQLVAQLTAEIARLEQMRAENQKLRAQLATPGGSFTAEEAADVAKMQERARLIGCINNLKQLGLASRLWANDNHDVYPPNVLCMSNEMATPKILVCPADTGRQPAADWSSFTSASTSYEYLMPGGSDHEPTRVLFRCPIHGNIGLADGSVQGEVARKHPEWLVERAGKIYMEPKAVKVEQYDQLPPENSKP